MDVGVIENLDGSIKVVYPADGFTVQDNFDRMGDTGFEMDKSGLPDSRVFRNAWEVSGGNAVAVNLSKAKQLATVALSKPYDEDMKAIAAPLAEAQDNIDHPLEIALINDRKALRAAKALNMQEIIDCTTVSQLEALMP